MKRTVVILSFIIFIAYAPSVYGQQPKESRVKTRELVAQLLNKVGPDISVTFSQSQRQPFKYAGTLKTGLTHAESLEIVVNVTDNETIGFRIYPHYKGGYINVDKLKNSAAVMRQLLRFSDRAFLFWGVDEAGDVFTGYTFTLESGFPEESIKIVLRSIANSDKFVGELRPLIDGSSTPASSGINRSFESPLVLVAA